jgi:ATP-dependent protease ClpP protease subunit
MRYPIKCRISNEGSATRVDVYDDIGGGGPFSGGVSASDFATAIAGVRGSLDVHINSGGGIVWDGIAIMNAIKGHKGKVTTVVDGLAASIASVIAQSGHERVMQPGSMLMIHDAFAPFEGNAAEMAKMASTLDQVSDNLAGIYASRAGGTADEWRARMRTETWFSADDAVRAGLADRVAGQGAVIPAGYDLAAYHVPAQIAASLRSLPVITAADLVTERDLAAWNRVEDRLRAIVRDEIAAADGNHAPMTGTHAHSHPAYGADGGGSHAHEHDHDGDASHDHSHAALDAADSFTRSLRNAGNGWTQRDGGWVFDPDGDGDDDSTPDGDTDHDYFDEDGSQIRAIPPNPATGKGGRPMTGNRNTDAVWNAKYNTDDRKRMAASGQAMPDGSYPIADEEDLRNAIHAVGRGGADHDAIRRHIIKRARALGASSQIPDNWNSDGSLNTSAGDSLAAEFLALVTRTTPARAGKE